MVATLQVNLDEEISPLELVKKVINPRNGIAVPDCDFVYGSVINAESPSPILFLPQYNRGFRKGRSWV
jgi:hypothetical protein